LGIYTKIAATNTYITLDINLSVKLIVTPSKRIIYANALNEGHLTNHNAFQIMV